MDGLNEFNEQVKANPLEALSGDLYQTIQDGNLTEARGIHKELKLFLNDNNELNFLNASKWMQEDEAEPNQIIENLFDAGDKLAIIGSSKMRKSFLTLQLCLCLATGKPFLALNVPKKRRVIYIQFEIKESHFQGRLKRMCRAMEIEPDDLEDWFWILNARGLGLAGADGLEKIGANVKGLHPELIVLDPLYKIFEGTENAAEDMKRTLAGFDTLVEETGAALGYVHHDAKGSPGDRNIQDRGAGSNVLSRDYDAGFTMTEHVHSTGVVVMEFLLRNYPPIEPFSIQWTNEGEGYCYRRADDIIPQKKTSKTKPAPPALSTYYPTAKEILGTEEMNISLFKTKFKEETRLSDARISDFMNWALDPKEPRFLMREIRGRGKHEKLIRLADSGAF